METLLLAASIVVPAVYAWTAVVYLKLLLAEEERTLRPIALTSLLVALALHTAYLAAISGFYHRCPLASRGEALLFGAWILALVHTVNERFTRSQSLGVFTILPPFIGVIGAVLLRDAAFDLPAEYRNSLILFHIVASIASYVCYCIAGVFACMYVLQHRRLKRKNFDVTFRKMPSLEQLDSIAGAWALTGSISLLAGVAIGLYGLAQNHLTAPKGTLLPVWIVLLIFLGSGVARRFLGWRGLRHIRMVLLGFIVLLAISLLSFLKFHGFYT